MLGLAVVGLRTTCSPPPVGQGATSFKQPQLPKDTRVPSGPFRVPSQCHGTLRLSLECRPFGPGRSGLAAAVPCVTALRRGGRWAQGGWLPAGDDWVRSRGVAAPPTSPWPAGGRGLLEAVAQLHRERRHSKHRGPRRHSKHRGLRWQEARKEGGTGLEAALLSAYGRALQQRPPCSCTGGRNRSARLPQCHRDNCVHDDARCAGSRGSGGCYGAKKGFE